MIQAFDLGFEGLEVVFDHAAQDPPLLLVGPDVLVCDLLYIFHCVAGVHLLALQVVLYAPLCLTDGAGTLACDATPDLNSPQCVYLA